VTKIKVVFEPLGLFVNAFAFKRKKGKECHQTKPLFTSSQQDHEFSSSVTIESPNETQI
jgi:hypothetical protein